MVVPISPIGGFSVGPLVQTPTPGGSSSSTGTGSFSQVLANSIGQIDQAQAQADQQTQALATGQASDLSTVVMSVEQASLEVSLASQVQSKVLDAYQSLFSTQV